MRKLLLSIAMAIVFAIQLPAQSTLDVLVGDENSGSSSYNLPIMFNYDNSYSQVLYLADELVPGTIYTISYYFEGNPKDAASVIYMGEVDNTEFGATDTWIPVTDLTEVFNGTLSYSEGWVTITLATPFEYTASGSLVVAYLSNRGVYESRSFRSVSAETNMSMYCYRDSSPYDLADLPNANFTYSRPITKFGVVPDGDFCWNVSDLTVSNITSSGVTVSWTAHESSTTFVVEYKAASDAEWTTAVNDLESTSYTITALSPMESYEVRVYTLCGEETSPSRKVNFVTAPTDDMLLGLPYSQNFDDADAVTNWSFVNNATNGWYIGTATNNAYDDMGTPLDGGALYISNDNGGATNSYDVETAAISYAYALVAFPEEGQSGITFDWKGLGEGYCDYLRVYLVPTNYELSSVSLPNNEYALTDAMFGSSTWQTKSIILPESASGNSYKLVLAWKNDGSDGENPPIAIDNLEIFSTPCLQVNTVEVGDMTDEGSSVSAEIIVTDDNDEAEYLVEYRAADSQLWSSVTSASPVTLVGLSYATTYQVKVTALCGPNSAISSDIIEFNTICGAITEFPHTEGFENFVDYEYEEAPMCWMNIDGGSSSYYFYQGEDPYSGTYSLAYAGSYSTYYEYSDWMISPTFVLSGTQMLSFQMKNTGDGSWGTAMPSIEVFVCDVSESEVLSGADTTRFTHIGTINHNNTDTEYAHYELSLAEYSGNYRLALAVRQTCRSFKIDDFVVDEIPECPNVYGVTAALADATSAAVTFNTSNGNGSGWVVAYGVAANANEFDPETAEQVTVGSVEELPVIIPNLVQGNTYYFAVKQNCDGGLYSSPVSVYVPQVQPLPYNQNFDDVEMVTEWEFVQQLGTQSWAVGTAENNTMEGETLTENGGAMYVSTDNGVTSGYDINSQSQIYAVTVLEFPQAASYTVSFDYKVGGEDWYGSPQDFMDVYLVPSTSETLDPYGNNITETLLMSNGWQHKSVELLNREPGVYKLVFKWLSGVSDGTQPGAVIDNISVVANECAAISSVTATPIAPETMDGTPSISVAINDNNGDDVTYTLRYKAENAEDWEEVTGLTSTSFPYVIGELEFETLYNIQVAVVCANGEVTTARTASARTSCQINEVSWNEPFDASPFVGSCWLRKAGLLPATGTVLTSTLSNGAAWSYEGGMVKINLWGSAGRYWLITPQINLEAGDTYQLAFDVKLTAYSGGGAPQDCPDDRLAVLVSTDAGASWDLANATIFADGDEDTEHNFVDFTNTPARYYITLEDAEGEPIEGIVRIAFYAESTVDNGDNNLWIDNIVVEPYTSCLTPSSLAVTAGTLSSTSVGISFTENGASTQWQYVIAEGETVNTETATPVPFSESDLPLTIDALEVLTTYTIAIRSVCGEGEFSAWSTPLTFTTSMEAVALPYTCDFEVEGNNGWLLNNGTLTNRWFVGQLPAGEEETNGALFVSGDNGATAGYIVNSQTVIIAEKLFETGDSEELTISFDLSVGGEDSYDYLKVFWLPATETFEPSSYGTYYSNIGYTDNAIISTASSSTQSYVNLLDGTQRMTATVANLENTQRKLVFVWVNDISGGNGNGPIIDNISIVATGTETPDPEPCDAPTNVTVSNITTTEATVAWEGTASSYEVRLNGGETTTVQTTTKTFATLTPATDYNVEVRAVCEGANSEWVSASFSTLSEGGEVIAPTVATLAATAVTHESAVLNGTVTAGNEAITAQGFKYQAQGAADWTEVSASGETMTATLSGLTAETVYSFKAFATTASGTTDGEIMTFTTTAAPVEVVAPIVTTLAASEITANAATLNGTITAGNEAITSQGFMYRQDGAAEWTTAEVAGENITLALTDLAAATTYNYKAFATTESGTTEGEEMSFTTLAGLADVANGAINAMIYPNPASDKATLSVEGLNAEAQIVVSDAQGRILFSDTMNAGENTYELNTANYAAGVYYVRILSGNTISTQKLIVR